jgi:hypothetical protein
MQLHMPRRGAAVAVLVAIVVGGCFGRSGTGAEPPAGAGAGPETTQAPATTTAPPAGGTATTAGPSGNPAPTTSGDSGGDLADGRHPARILAVSDSKKTVRFDVIQFLTGDAANKAAAEDGEESPPPNDYYIRNTNPKIRTLSIAPSVTVTVNVLAATETGSSTKDTRITLAKLAGFPRDRVDDAVFWLTVSHGKVTRIEEQYLP